MRFAFISLLFVYGSVSFASADFCLNLLNPSTDKMMQLQKGIAGKFVNADTSWIIIDLNFRDYRRGLFKEPSPEALARDLSLLSQRMALLRTTLAPPTTSSFVNMALDGPESRQTPLDEKGFVDDRPLSIEEIQKIADLAMEHASSTPPPTKEEGFQIRETERAWRSTQASDSDEFNCPSYWALKNQLSFDLESGNWDQWSIAESFAYIHEVEHVFQTHQLNRNEIMGQKFLIRLRHSFKIYVKQLERDVAELLKDSGSLIFRQIGGLIVTLQEVPSIGAQWELASRIPGPIRQRMISILETERSKLQSGQSSYARDHQPDEKLARLNTAIDIRTIAIESLKRGHYLSKRRFIMELLPYHRYDSKAFLHDVRNKVR